MCRCCFLIPGCSHESLEVALLVDLLRMANCDSINCFYILFMWDCWNSISSKSCIQNSVIAHVISLVPGCKYSCQCRCRCQFGFKSRLGPLCHCHCWFSPHLKLASIPCLLCPRTPRPRPWRWKMQLDFAADLGGILELRVRSCVSGPVVPVLALQTTRQVPLSGQVRRKRMMTKTLFPLKSWKRVKKPVWKFSKPTWFSMILLKSCSSSQIVWMPSRKETSWRLKVKLVVNGEIHVVEEGDADVSSSSYDSQETLILGETRHARRWFVILNALSCVLSWQASTDHVMIQRYQESVYKFFVVDPDPLKWPNSRVVWWGFNSDQFKLAILDAVWLSTVRSRPGTINVWRWRKCKCCCSFSCFEPNWNVCFISMNTHVSVCVYILVKFPLHQSKGPDMSC